MDQNFDDVHHGERPPHLVSFVRDWTKESFHSEDRVGKLIEGVGNYLIATPLRVGNSVIVSSQRAR